MAFFKLFVAADFNGTFGQENVLLGKQIIDFIV